MATIKNFEDAEIWQMARKLALKIWALTKEGTFSKDRSLCNQINAAAGSVMDNIAEGFGRGGNKELKNFLGYARGSNEEVRSQLFRALDRNHIPHDVFKETNEEANKLSTKISNLIEYLKKSEYRGQKFNH